MFAGADSTCGPRAADPTVSITLHLLLAATCPPVPAPATHPRTKHRPCFLKPLSGADIDSSWELLRDHQFQFSLAGGLFALSKPGMPLMKTVCQCVWTSGKQISDIGVFARSPALPANTRLSKTAQES